MSVGRLLLIIIAALVLPLVRPAAAATHGTDRLGQSELGAGPTSATALPAAPIRTAALADMAIPQIAPVIVSDGAILDRTALIGRILLTIGGLLTLLSAARMLVL